MCIRDSAGVLENVRASGDPSTPSGKALLALNRYMARDGVHGFISHRGQSLINIPGTALELGPFVREVSRCGRLIKLGGKDKSAHATLLDDEGNSYTFEIDWSMAKELKKYLFEGYVRIHGDAKFRRDGAGDWAAKEFRGKLWQPVKDMELEASLIACRETLSRIRSQQQDS